MLKEPLTKPGIYRGMLCQTYFADPCPTPSITQSIAKEIYDYSPRHGWVKHPRLNPHYEPDESTKFNIGNAAHWHLIGRGKELYVVEAADWKTKAAREERDQANAAGKCAVLRWQFDVAGEMAEACLDQLNERGLVEEWDPKKGDGEVVLAWREGDVWLRSLVDWLPKHLRTVWDYKTTDRRMPPRDLSNRLADWAFQAAMHERGLDVLDPKSAGRRAHLFVCQENKPPFAITVSQIPEDAMSFGRRELSRAIETWEACMARGRNPEAWPMYDLEVQYPHYTEWQAARRMDRVIAASEAPMLTDLSGG